jgi:2,3-bisphosphoglycerate-independent phosphoglycerate mutase
MSKGRKAVELLTSTDYTMGFLHIKAVDEAGHDKSVELKIEYIEKSDDMIGNVIQELQKDELLGERDYTIVLTGDHTTPVLLGEHSHEPVPFTMSHVASHAGSTIPQGIRIDQVTRFDEAAVAHGFIGQICGAGVMDILRQYMGLTSDGDSSGGRREEGNQGLFVEESARSGRGRCG